MIDYISQIILIDVSAFKWNCWNCFVSDVMILWLHSWHSTAKERTYLIEFKAIEFFWTTYLYYLYDLSTGLACIDCFVSTFPLLSVMSHWNVRACIICALQCVVCFKGLVFDFKAVAFLYKYWRHDSRLWFRYFIRLNDIIQWLAGWLGNSQSAARENNQLPTPQNNQGNTCIDNGA